MVNANLMVVKNDDARENYAQQALEKIAREFVAEHGAACLIDLDTPAFVRLLSQQLSFAFGKAG